MNRFITQGSVLLLGPLLFVLVCLLVHPPGMSDEARLVLAGTLWMAAWWITEAVPIPVTALLPLIVFPMGGAMRMPDVTRAYSDPIIFLFIGGFIVAIAIEKWGLHRRIALNTIARTGAHPRNIILGFMVATAAVSMWISNTATVVMMLPIAMALTKETDIDSAQSFGKTLMLAIAYAASIGGLATLIGTPTNMILAGMVREILEEEISFMRWMVFGLPVSLLLLGLCWVYLTRNIKGKDAMHIGGSDIEITRLLKDLGRISYEERAVAIVFGLMAFFWLTRGFLLNRFLPTLDDSMIALCAAIALFVIPTRAKDSALMTWSDAIRIPWGIILLFGAGFAIAAGFQTTGLDKWIAGHLDALHGLPLFVIVLLIVGTVNFLTEITSNMATASMFIPVLAAGAAVMDVHPFVLMVGVTTAASCAFMLPIATAPNAIVFGSGYLRIPDMVRAGVWMNLLSIVLVTLAVVFFLPLIWKLH